MHRPQWILAKDVGYRRNLWWILMLTSGHRLIFIRGDVGTPIGLVRRAGALVPDW